MKLKDVQSTAMKQIGYDEDKKELHIVFNSGKEYSYQDVDKQVFEDMQTAKSLGTFFAKNVLHRYKHKLVEEEENNG